jgi:hypothetical protein
MRRIHECKVVKMQEISFPYRKLKNVNIISLDLTVCYSIPLRVLYTSVTWWWPTLRARTCQLQKYTVIQQLYTPQYSVDGSHNRRTVTSLLTTIRIYRLSQNLCHKLFLGIPHPHLSKKVPINKGPKVNRVRDIDLRPCAGIEYYIRCSKCWPFAATHPLRCRIMESLPRSSWNASGNPWCDVRYAISGPGSLDRSTTSVIFSVNISVQNTIEFT